MVFWQSSTGDGKVVKEERENHDKSRRQAMAVVKVKEEKEEEEKGGLANSICLVAEA